MTADPAQLVGQTVGERYAIEALIGSGGMGVVYRASDLEEDRVVAVKILATTGDEGVADRFRREGRVMARLGHDNVVQVHDAGSMSDGRPYIVMEHLVGESLAARQKREPLARENALAVVLQVCDALGAVHGVGVVHRDLKPQNIFLARNESAGDDIGRVVVLDFGISKMLGSMTVETASSVLLGTPQYMAPEQARGDRELISPRSDLFALGVITYELLAGRMPFDGESVYEIVYRVTEETPNALHLVDSDCPAHISNAVAVSMAKEPRDRFANAEEFAAALRGEITVEAPRPRAAPSDSVETVAERPRARESAGHAEPAAPRSRRRLAIAVAAASVVAIGAAAFVWTQKEAARPTVAPLVAANEAKVLGDLGLEADAARNPVAALDFLARAYAAGDRRRVVRIALRHRLISAESLLFARRFEVSIQGVEVAPSGAEIAVTTTNGTHLFDRDGAHLEFLRGERVLEFSPGGTYRATVVNQDNVRVTDRKSGAIVYEIADAASYFWRSDTQLVSSTVGPGGGPTFSLHDVPTRTVKWARVCGAYTRMVYDYSADRLVACDSAVVVDLDTGKMLLSTGPIHRGEPRIGRLILSHDGALLLMSTGDQHAVLIDVETQERVVLDGIPIGAGTSWSTFTPKSRTLVVTSNEALQSLHVDRQPLRVTPIRRYGEVDSIESANLVDEDTLLIGTSRGLLRLVSLRTGATLGELAGHRSVVEFAVSAHGTIASSAGAELRLWRRPNLRVRALSSTPADSGSLSADGRTAVVRVKRDWSRIDVATSKRTPLAGPGRLTPDRALVVVGKQVTDLATGAPIATLPDTITTVAAVSNDAALITTFDPVRVHRRDGANYSDVTPPSVAPHIIAPSPDASVFAVVVPRGDKISDFDVAIHRASDGTELVRHSPPPGAPYATFLENDILVTPAAGGLRAWNWRTNNAFLVRGSAAPFRAEAGVLITVRGGETVRTDLRTGRPLSSTAACVGGGLRIARNGLSMIRCRIGSTVLLWDGEASWMLTADRFDNGRLWLTDISIEGDSAIIGGKFGLLAYDLEPESRPGAEVLDLVRRSKATVRVP